MGFQVTAYAIEKVVRPASVKLTFIVLAGNADDETGEAFPSINFLCDRTSQDRKTVIKALGRLVTLGLIEDTGKRRGRSQRVKVYRVVGAPFKTVPKSGPSDGPKIPNKTVPNFPGDSPKNGTRNQSGNQPQGISQGINHQESGGEIPPPPLPVVTPGGDDEVLSYAEQQRILSEIALKAFKRPVRPADWSNSQKDTWLSEAQPVTRGQMAALRWLYELPPTHRVFTATQRRQSLEKLLEVLCSEIDKAVSLQAEFGVPLAKKTARAPEPDGWRAAYVALWGERDDMPEHFHQLTGTLQQSVRKRLNLPNDNNLESEGY